MVMPIKKKGAKPSARKGVPRKKKGDGPSQNDPIVEIDTIDPSLDLVEQILVNIHGPSSSGKTIAALTASQYYPKSGIPLPKGKKIMLRDVCHVGWDAAALIGAKSCGLCVAYPINVPHLLSKGRKSAKDNEIVFKSAEDILDAFDRINDSIDEIVSKDHNITLTIDDTVSRMDRYLVAFWSHDDNIPVAYKDGKEIDDTQGMYRKIFLNHHQYQARRICLPGDVRSIFLFHCRVIGDEGDDAKLKKSERGKKKLIRLSKDVAIVPQITGQGLDLYTNDASIEFACLPSTPTKGNLPERRLWTVPSDGYRTKNRFQHLFKECEPAHMGKIFDKIRAACA